MAADGAGLSRSRRQDGQASLWVSHSMLILTQLSFAGGFIFIKFTLTSGVSPLVLAVYRDVIALIVLIPIAYFMERRQRPTLDFTILALCALLGATGMFGSQLLVLNGLALGTAALGSLVSAIIPVGVFIISAIFGLEEINWRGRDGLAKVAGCISAVTGAVLIPLYRGPVLLGTALPGVHGDRLSELHLDDYFILAPILLHLVKETWQIGAILLLLAGMSTAIYICLQVITLRRYPAPISLTALSYGFGALMLVPIALTIEDRSDWVVPQPTAVMSIVYVGLIPSAFNFAATTWAVRRTGPVLLASYSPVQSIVTACLGHLVLGESIYLGSGLGTLFIINGLLLITWGRLDRRRKAAAHPVEVVVAPDGLAIIRGPSDLKEPLLG